MANDVLTLLTDAEETGAGTAARIRVTKNVEQVLYVIRGITTATVKIQGSLDGTNWVDLASATADEGGGVTAMPYMRANVTAYTTGTIVAELYADKVFTA
jgi:hypothetical protein